jgi:hypothetical protein
MTNKEWYLSLSNDLQDKVAHNCNSLNEYYRFAQWYDDKKGASICGAFCWDDSIEGNEFWYGVYKTMENL